MDDYKIIKKLGQGVMGTTFLVKKDNVKYALKLQRVLKKDIKQTYKSPLWREIEFSKFTKKHPDQFIQLIDYEFIDNCSHKQNMPKYVENMFAKKQLDAWKKIQMSDYCIKFIYELRDGVLSDIINKLNKKEFYSCVIQVINIIYLLMKAGYTHSDIHFGNVMYKKVPKNTTIKIFDKKVPTYGYIYSAIDYGLILHKKYELSRYEKKAIANKINDLTIVMDQFNISKNIWKVLGKNKVPFLPFKNLYDKIKKEPEYKIIKPILEKYTKQEQGSLILNLFAVLNQKRMYEIAEFTKYIKVDKYILKQKIDIDDFIYIYSNFYNPKKIILYLYNKLIAM